MEDISIDGATGIIINITGNDSITMHETNEAVTLITETADDEAQIIFGTVIDEDMEDAVKVTVIATGLGGEKNRTKVKSVDPLSPPRKEYQESPAMNMAQERSQDSISQDSVDLGEKGKVRRGKNTVSVR